MPDLGHVAAAINVRFAGPVAALAADPLVPVFKGKALVGIRRELLCDLIVAGGASLRAHEIGGAGRNGFARCRRLKLFGSRLGQT